ncbi:MAG: hypothetical protein SPE19_12260 [Candidatus Faecousia sp.]|nr:hypothetical protein [Candidatus Faecousia sp.]
MHCIFSINSVLRRRRFGFVFQSYNLVKELMGYENILLPVMLDSRKPDEEYLRQHRIMGQGDSARDFGTSESMENAGILDVFPIFHTARLGQKILRSPLSPLCGVALNRIIDLLGIRDRMSHLPGAMSGGQQQRFCIARALPGTWTARRAGRC